MRAMVLRKPGPIESNPLELVEIPPPKPKGHEVLIRVTACGVCHTDLHITEGDIELPRLPIIPGHQIVGRVEAVGEAAWTIPVGERVGLPWLYHVCGECGPCLADQENLCDHGQFTGLHVHGGYAEYVLAHEDYVYPIPKGYGDAEATSLLCGGVIGFRALQLCSPKPNERIGMVGFGNSAQVTVQIARAMGCRVYVFTRSKAHRRLATELGAEWVGGIENDPGVLLDKAIIFAPAGPLVPLSLRLLRKGGTLALAGITMSQIPAMPYSLLYGERVVRSVANSTRDDIKKLLFYAGDLPLKLRVTTFALELANEALRRMKHSELEGGAALVM